MFNLSTLRAKLGGQDRTHYICPSAYMTFVWYFGVYAFRSIYAHWTESQADKTREGNEWAFSTSGKE